MDGLPDGVVTFLFTDVEGSTRLWEESSDHMMEALRIHDETIETAVDEHHGVSVKPRGEGDSHFVVFRSARDAIAGAAEMQRRLADVTWPTPRPLRVRASLHTGTAQLELGDYYGSVVNRAARLRAIAHGGQTVISGATFDLIRDHLPPGITLTDMGMHRLKDLTRPEHVFQLNVDGLAGAFPPLKSLDAVPNNLPEQLTDLVGRDTELAEAKRMIAEHRLVTILAPGGTGKTRLSIQAAADLTSEYPDGVFFIALADISTSDDILQTVAEAVGVALSSSEDPRAQLLTYLAPRRQLLVFDNFEHVSEGALIVSDILKAAPDLTVIATSRSRLNLTGEAVLALTGLDTSWTTPEEAQQTSGVLLFLDAARRVKPDFSLGDDDLEPMAEILRLTGGIPLGILLAAAWVDVLSVREIAAEIAKSLDFLETSAVDAPDRHRSIRAVFDYTWGLLAPEEQQVFAALSVFRGGFTRDAASSVADASVRDLANLAGKSLVSSNPDSGRYSVHELLRQYAQAELETLPEHHSEITRRHADYFAALTRRAFEHFAEGRQGESLDTLEADLDNIRPAFRHHLATRNAGGVRRMVGGLYVLHDIRGWYQAGLALFGDIEGTFEGDDRPEAIVAAASLRWPLALVLSLLGRPQDGVTTADPAVEAMRRHGTTEELFFALLGKSSAHLYERSFVEAADCIEEMSGFEDEPDSQWTQRHYWIAGLKPLGAFVALATGDRSRAQRLLDESSAVLEPLGDSFYMTWNLGHRGRLARSDGRLEEAVDLFARSADLARSIGFLRGLQVSLVALGDASLGAGRLDEAEAAFVESLDAANRTGMIAETLGTLVRVAGVFAARGRETEAVSMLAAVLAEPLGDRQVFTDTSSIASNATTALDGLRQSLDDEAFDVARQEGSRRSYGALVKELLDSRA